MRYLILALKMELQKLLKKVGKAVIDLSVTDEEIRNALDEGNFAAYKKAKLEGMNSGNV